MKLLNIFKFPQDKLKSALTCHLRDKGYSPISDDGFVYAAGFARRSYGHRTQTDS